MTLGGVWGNGARPIGGDTNVPENDQAWSIAAALAIKWRRGHGVQVAPSTGWQRVLEEDKMSAIPPVPLLCTFEEIEAARRSHAEFALNVDEGWRRETAFIRAHDLPVTSS